MKIESRLRRLEKVAPPDYADVLALIRSGCFYDELDNEQRDRYCEYLGFEKDVVEAVDRCIRGDLHFPLKLKEKPLVPGTPEFAARVKEIERLMSIDD